MPQADSAPPNAPRALPVSALTAFLHGIQPRAWVFALCQGGDAARADAALAGAEREFIAEAGAHPLAEWPMRFWATLLRQPALVATLDPGLELARLEPGPRAALLLRLLASLDVPHAAEALGVSVRAYEAALGQALAAPGAPPDWLPTLRIQLQALVHDLPAPTRAHLDELRQQAMAQVAALPATAATVPGPEDAPTAAPTPVEFAAPPDAPEWHPPRWPWFGLGLLLLALLATLLFPLPGRLRPGESEALPGEAVPPPPELNDSVVVTHPDYAQLARPGDEAFARDLAFLSWHAANLQATPSAPGAAAGAVAPVAVATEAAAGDFSALSKREQRVLSAAATLWPTLPADERSALRRHANDWHHKSRVERAAMRARLRAWDEQAAAERARRRAPFQAWRALTPGEQERVRAARARFAALPPAEAQAVRARFAALDADTQRVWWLGPALGQQLEPIAVMFAFLPEGDRPALLDALRGLDPVARAELSLLAPRLQAGPRQALRKQLLSLPAGERGAYIHQRLAELSTPKSAL